MDSTPEEDLFRKSLKVNLNSLGLKNPANNNGTGDNSGGVSGSIAGHGADGGEMEFGG